MILSVPYKCRSIYCIEEFLRPSELIGLDTA